MQAADPAMWVKSRQFTGRIVTVSNSRIFSEPVFNYTREFPYLWEEMSIPISFKENRARVEEILLKAADRYGVQVADMPAEECDRIKSNFDIGQEDMQPHVYFRITDNWLELTVRFLVDTHRIRSAKDAISREIVDEFDAGGISIASATYDIVGFPPPSRYGGSAALLKKWLHQIGGFLSQTFWLIPRLMVVAGIASAIGLIEWDRSGLLPKSLLQGTWLYNGGGTGARTLLGTVAASTIGVAGTVFSITIAALSLAAGQMGPRLLRNFTQDRGNQVTLGAFLGTFSYSLMVLRSVRTLQEGVFVPHLALSVSIAMAFGCVGMLVYFVGHMASRINVDTVVGLVSIDVKSAIKRLTTEEEPNVDSSTSSWSDAVPVFDDRRGYLEHLDEAALVDWAASHQMSIKLLVRVGDYVFPGSLVALVQPPAESVAEVIEAIQAYTALAPDRTSSADLEYSVRQLVEVAVRALSPGINDPHTAISVLDRLGASLCDMVGRNLPNGVWIRDGRICLVVPSVDYDGFTDAMFHMIRQNAAGSTAVLVRIIDVLIAVASCEPKAARCATLARHAKLVVEDGRRTIGNPADLHDLLARVERFEAVRCGRFA